MSTTAPVQARTRAPWPALTLALGLHVALVLALGHWRAPNLWENGAIADALLEGRGFSVPIAGAAGAFEPTSWQAPGYPLLLWALWSILGKSATAHLALSLLQALATASVVLPLRALAVRWYGERAGVAAQWLAAVLPLHAWYSTRLHHTGLVLALAPWALLACVRLRDQPSRRDIVLAGASLGALGLLQPVLLGALVVYALALALALALGRTRAQARPIALALLVTLGCLAPWTARNAVVHGRLVPIKGSFGKELWLGNNPHATGTAYAPGGLEPLELAHPPACAARADLREAERFAAMGAEARAFVAADPAGFVARTARKVAWLWTWVPGDLVRHGLGGEAVRYRWLHTACWLGLCALALLGARDLPREHAAALVALFGVASIVYGLTHVGQARFRGEVEFVLVPLAAHGLARLLGRSPVIASTT